MYLLKIPRSASIDVSIMENIKYLSKILTLLRAWDVNWKLLVSISAKRLIFGSLLYLVFLRSYIFFINNFYVIVNVVVKTEEIRTIFKEEMRTIFKEISGN